MSAVALTTKRTYRSDRQVQREANILAVTRQALADKGYDGVTMNALAAEAGVTKRTLYNLYGGKDQLLHAAVGEVIAKYRGVEQISAPGIEAIVSSRTNAVDEVIATPTYSDAMTRALVQVADDHPLTDTLLTDSLAFTTHHLQVAVTRGDLAETLPAEDLARQIVSQGWGMVLLRMKGVLNAQQFRSASLQGLTLLLLSVAQGSCRAALQQQLEI